MAQDYYEIATPPANQLIEFDATEAWCKDLSKFDTDLVNALIITATNMSESITNRVFVRRTINGFFSNLCASLYEPLFFVEVRRAPLISVTSITINGTLVDSSNYYIKKSSGYSRILFDSSISVDTTANIPYPIEIVFDAGYILIPEEVKTAAKQCVLFWYENRGDVTADGEESMPAVARKILRQHRIVNTYG